MNAVFGYKQKQSQVFLADGTRLPVTVVSIPQNVVTQLKDEEKDGYKAIQVGIDTSKKNSKSFMGHVKKSNMSKAPAFVREVRLSLDTDATSLTPGTSLALSEMLQPGDIIVVSGVSKGKGFAGGVKRYGFRGGPKTHGQSDRHRAPGSIGQGTTPGRVYKGKRMAGHMGHANVSIKNLVIVDIKGSDVYVSGLIPGSRNSLVRLEKIGEKKNFVPVFSLEEEGKEESAKENLEAASEQTNEPQGSKEAKTKAAENSSKEEIQPEVDQNVAEKEEANASK